ncbi:NAD(P)H-binding protein [Streptomyces sp. NPDC051940]|uniref:NAD(P)H-binding protein n=1 Tax=Streptomyces sp. NPDC051940 TaxID=3155675 RepID=UPI003421B533
MITVTGATGNIGRVLVEILSSSGQDVRAVSRSGPHPADLGDPASLKDAFAGADSLFLLLAGEQLVTGPDPRDVLSLAAAAGVKRTVLLSSQAAGTRPDFGSHERLRQYETAVRESGLDWTVLRPGGFTTNTFAWAESVRTHRAVYAPFGDVALPLIDPADIAAVAAAALQEDGHTGRTYELTGPAPVTPREQAAAIAGALSEPVTFHELTPAAARETLLGFMPPEVADGTLAILGSPTAREARVSPDVETVLGRPGRSFAEWAAANGGVFR